MSYQNSPAKDERVFVASHTACTNDCNLRENNACHEHPVFNDFHGPFHSLDQFSGPYNQFDRAGSLVDYQHTFQPVGLNPSHHMQAYSGAEPLSVHTPTTFHNLEIPEQLWVDEIHPSYTPIRSETFGWIPVNDHSNSWLINTNYSSQAEQPVYETTSSTNTLLGSQFSPPTSTEAFAQGLHWETTARFPSQQKLSTRPASVALQVRTEKFNKDITTVSHKNVGEYGQKPLRISKVKRPEKRDNNVKQEACWRCKRYRKACIGKDICKECSTAGFRVWPSAIGCRRGAMEGFVEKIMPAHSIGVLRDLRLGVLRTSNWRKALYKPDDIPFSPIEINPTDRWDFLKIKVQSTMVFGPDFSALVDVLAGYEQARKIEIPIWTQSILLLSSTCDFYHFFVASSNTEVSLPHLINATIKLRKSLAKSWDMFLKLCLSGSRENWFPAFLTVVLGICSMVILLDAVPSVPDPTRKAIWADVEEIVRDLRVRQHMMTLDLLKIGAKGINPLKLDCWVTEDEVNSDGQNIQKRNAKGMALLGHDSAAFDGFIALSQWHARYKTTMLQGNDMWESVPFTKSYIKAIAALSRVFEF